MDRSVIGVISRRSKKAPVDIFSIIQDLGIKLELFPMTDDLQELSGYIQNLGNGRYTIAVNTMDHEVRQRFTAAHELGHYIYHRHLISDGVDDNRAYRSTAGGKFSNKSIGPVQERQANQFAANLLMPQHLIAQLKDGGVQNSDDLARCLNVSKSAMRVRLKSL